MSAIFGLKYPDVRPGVKDSGKSMRKLQFETRESEEGIIIIN